MANKTSSNGSSSFPSKKASAPSPSSKSSDEAESPKSTPSKSQPRSQPSLSPPSPSPQAKSSPPPVPGKTPPPTPSHSPPPSPSPPSPSPPSPSPSPPTQTSPPATQSPPPPSQSPPPPSQSSPPPSQYSPPPSIPSPSSGSAPPPSPWTPPQSPPVPLLQSPPPPQNSPPSQFQAPPPPSFSPPTAIPTPPSRIIPPPAPTGSRPNHPSPPPSPPVPQTKSRVIFFIFRRKKKRGSIYAMPPHRKSHMKGGGDVHYYVEEPGFGNGQAAVHLRTSSDTAQLMNAGQIVFTYEKVAEITNGFSSENIIGEGGFGYVYKASMPDGRIGAVKMLKAGSGQGEREFRAEVDIISRVHHRHLVSLIGYCICEQQRVLIYEFVPNGNLSQHLHGNEWPILDWPKRMKIAIGAARGLAYLHEGCNPRIIHRDIKSENILLDDAYEAEVADFGLARLTDDANTHVSTRVMGTFGYMAPEYATSGKLTDRSDVFSFGVVLLELITGRKPVDTMQPIGEESLVEWARPHLLRAIETGDFAELVDPRLEMQYVDSEMFRMIEAAAACVRHSGPKRPRMVQVARALDSGDQLYDLSNGVKYGQSTVYDSGQYNEDIMRFRRMANGSYDDSEFDMYSTEYRSTVSREMSGSKYASMPYSAGGDSEVRPFHSQRSNTEKTCLEGTHILAHNEHTHIGV